MQRINGVAYGLNCFTYITTYEGQAFHVSIALVLQGKKQQKLTQGA